jgi:uncharacterized membrane protein YhdT
VNLRLLNLVLVVVFYVNCQKISLTAFPKGFLTSSIELKLLFLNLARAFEHTMNGVYLNERLHYLAFFNFSHI